MTADNAPDLTSLWEVSPTDGHLVSGPWDTEDDLNAAYEDEDADPAEWERVWLPPAVAARLREADRAERQARR